MTEHQPEHAMDADGDGKPDLADENYVDSDFPEADDEQDEETTDVTPEPAQPVGEVVAAQPPVEDEQRVVVTGPGGTIPDAQPGQIILAQADPTIDLTVDARNRALRSFLQGLAFDVVLAIVVYLGPVVFSWNSFEDIQWKIIVFSITKTVLVTVISFVMRKFADSSKLPSPKPPVISGDVINPSTTGNI